MHKWSMDWRGAVDSERGCMVTYFRFEVLPQTAVVHSRSTSLNHARFYLAWFDQKTLGVLPSVLLNRSKIVTIYSRWLLTVVASH